MAEPTSAYTLQDLLLRVAKAKGVAYHGANGDERAQIPVDEYNFYDCLDAVNDGIKMFIASAPPDGWRWMNRLQEVTFVPGQEDPSTYSLTQDFLGDVAGEVTYAEDSNHGHILAWTSEAEIRRFREVAVQTGYPRRAAVRPSSTNRRWELILDVNPSAADVVTFPYRVGFDSLQAEKGTATAGSATTLTDSSIAGLFPNDYFNGWTIVIIDGTGQGSNAVVTDYVGATGVFSVADWLTKSGVAGGTDPAASSLYFVSDGDKHPAGMQFDEAILAACLAKAELESEDLKVGYMNKFLEKDLPEAWRIDARSAPRKLGVMLPGTRRGGCERTWNDVTKT